MREVGARLVSPQLEGGCNGCTERTAKRVVLVHLRSTSFRLCQECIAQLLIQLQPYEDYESRED